MDTRDFYIKRLREKLGYRERSTFRRPVSEFLPTVRQSLDAPVVKRFRLNIVWRLLLWFFALVLLVKLVQKLL